MAEEDCHDFMVFDRDQKLSIQVYDEDRMSRDDFLGGTLYFACKRLKVIINVILFNLFDRLRSNFAI